MTNSKLCQVLVMKTDDGSYVLSFAGSNGERTCDKNTITETIKEVEKELCSWDDPPESMSDKIDRLTREGYLGTNKEDKDEKTS